MAVKIKVKGDPKKEGVTEDMYISKGRTPSDDTADIRDILSGIVGKGYTNLSDENSRASFARLRSILGDASAQKLMTHVFVQNQKPGFQTLPTEARIKSFYDTPSGDEEISTIIGRAKNLGYGVLPGYRSSSNQMLQELSGAIPTQTTAGTSPVAAQKVRLKIGQKVL